MSLTTLGFLRGVLSQQSLPVMRDDFEETALIAVAAKRELQAAIDAAEAREAASAAVEPTAGGSATP